MTAYPFNVEIFKGKGGLLRWYWRIVGLNGEIMAQSEGYFSKSNVKRAVVRIFPGDINIIVKD